MVISPRKLRSLGVIGMNERNIKLIAQYNPRHLYPLVDNKLKTKLLAAEKGVETPGLIAALKTQHDARRLTDFVGSDRGFVVKPAKGSGGKGILVIAGQRDEMFIKTNGQELTLRQVTRHASNVLSGLFSLGGTPDVGILEELIQPDPLYRNLSVEGVPDIRVIVYRGFPVMAMMRLSTRASDGKANLHQGAIGLGLSLATGKPVNAIQFDRPVNEHPDSGADLMSIRIPRWTGLLELAARSADATGMGYIGADIVIDRDRGPLLLELNARPGLAIQLANREGLGPRVKAVDRLPAHYFGESAAARVQRATEMFGAGQLHLDLPV
ncbi:MAG: alpha-L-glutamate ligase-like protein [Gammaproteobacteria bacterium]|nr:alpha-L-glutamate ligase-like protein [Gammaproteobacteria bacterium]